MRRLTKPRPREVLPLAKWIDEFLSEHERRVEDAQKIERERMAIQLARPVGPLSKFQVNDKVLVDWPTNETNLINSVLRIEGLIQFLRLIVTIHMNVNMHG